MRTKQTPGFVIDALGVFTMIWRIRAGDGEPDTGDEPITGIPSGQVCFGRFWQSARSKF
jgi:hypothetical protein